MDTPSGLRRKFHRTIALSCNDVRVESWATGYVSHSLAYNVATL